MAGRKWRRISRNRNGDSSAINKWPESQYNGWPNTEKEHIVMAISQRMTVSCVSA